MTQGKNGRGLFYPLSKTYITHAKGRSNYVVDPIKGFNVEKVGKYTYICSKHFVGGVGPSAMYTDPIPAIQIGSSSVVKKARPPRDRVTTRSPSESIPFEHNYASSSTCDVEVSVADDMDISFCNDDAETPSLADCCTRVSSTTFSDASTQAHPTMKDESTQTDSECDNWMRRKMFVDNLTANNKNCKFWTGFQTLSLLNFLFEWVLNVSRSNRIQYVKWCFVYRVLFPLLWFNKKSYEAVIFNTNLRNKFNLFNISSFIQLETI